MAVIRVDGFTGPAPAVSPRKLPNGAATVADACKFEGGDLLPWRAVNRAPVESSTHGSAAGQPAMRDLDPSLRTFNIGRIYRHVPMGSPDRPRWLVFPESPGGTRALTSVAPSPTANDIHDRIYWSRSDSYPRLASAPVQSMVSGAQVGGSTPRLGIPRPTAKPTAAVNAGAVSAATVSSVIREAPCRVVVPLAATFFQSGQRVLLDVDYPDPKNAVGLRSVAGKEFVIGDITTSPAGRTIELRGSNAANDEPLESGATVTLRRVYSDSDFLSRSYVYTYVSIYGEEGMPSPASDIVDVAEGIPVNVTFNFSPGNLNALGYNSISKIRLYRSETGQSGTEYFLVTEFPRANPPTGESATLMNGNLTIVDNIRAAGLGELLPSSEWAPPPDRVRGLGLMPNGIMACFKDNAMLFSEPYQPHAWPDRYRRTTERPIVGWAVFGQSAVVATQGRPYLVTGTDPASMSLQQLTLEAPCLGNGGGVVSTGGGVMFPTQDGLAYVSGAEQRILTQGQFTKDQWIALWENDMEAVWWDGFYIAFSTNTNRPTLCIRPLGNAVEIVRMPDIRGRSPVRDTITDRLFFVGTATTGSNLFNAICEFDAQLAASGSSNTLMQYRWQSKLFQMPKQEIMGAAEIVGDFAGAGVTLNIYAPADSNKSVSPSTGQVAVSPNRQYVQGANMQLIHSQFVTDSEPFRLPPFMAREWMIELAGNARIQSVTVASTMQEIRSV